ncbi:endocuticle structural protein SgAbd-6-like [Bombyx mandarina]|uniref:Endocuticle structural protein SgAbd-6-like n=2 Tax=Bombyx TaxID=7090 RepID=A0A6J2JWG2_BOMMA|nr:cuticular protein RR-1 motif 28 precursor [Bombyx mori]XP_028032524.1 endocuticle structural protein SgAbd-6-like [Bombyx mandarina]FAA00530.1 TPA: putative cuticle protein [Bombyx mori]
MKLLLALCLVGIVAASRPPGEAQLTSYENVHNGRGNYRFGYSQSDGTVFEQEGTLKNEGQEEESLAVRGKFSWVGPDGVTYTVTFVADEDGYQPEIEQGPGGAVPSAILHSLAG